MLSKKSFGIYPTQKVSCTSQIFIYTPAVLQHMKYVFLKSLFVSRRPHPQTSQVLRHSVRQTFQSAGLKQQWNTQLRFIVFLPISAKCTLSRIVALCQNGTLIMQLAKTRTTKLRFEILKKALPTSRQCSRLLAETVVARFRRQTI